MIRHIRWHILNEEIKRGNKECNVTTTNGTYSCSSVIQTSVTINHELSQRKYLTFYSSSLQCIDWSFHKLVPMLYSFWFILVHSLEYAVMEMQLYLAQEELEDTKVVIRICNSKKENYLKGLPCPWCVFVAAVLHYAKHVFFLRLFLFQKLLSFLGKGLTMGFRYVPEDAYCFGVHVLTSGFC